MNQYVCFYRSSSPNAPHKTVARRGKKFQYVKGMYRVPIEDEVDFLAIPVIAEAVASSRMWRDGPHLQVSDPPPDEPEPEISAPEPEPTPEIPSRRRNKNVRLAGQLDQGDVQPGQPDCGTERTDDGGDHATDGLPSDSGTESGMEDAE